MKPISETSIERAKRDPEYRIGLLDEFHKCVTRGETEVAAVLFHEYYIASQELTQSEGASPFQILDDGSIQEDPRWKQQRRQALSDLFKSGESK